MVPGTDHPADRPVPGPAGPVGHQFGALPEQTDEERVPGTDQRQAQVSQGGDRQENMHVARAVQPGERQGETGPGSRRRVQPQVVRLPTAVFPKRPVPDVHVPADQQLFVVVGCQRRCRSLGGVGHNDHTVRRHYGAKCELNKSKNMSLLLSLKRSHKQEFKTNNKITNIEQEILDKQVAKMIFATNSSFKIVEHPEFKVMIEMLRPGYKAPNRFKIINELLNKCSQNMTHTVYDKSVCMSIDGWSNIHNNSTICLSIHNIKEPNLHLDETIDTTDQPHTTQYLCDLAAKFICKCDIHNCKITSLVINSEVDMDEMREALAKHPELEGRDILTYRCSSHVLNLLSKDLQIPDIIEHLKTIIKYFKNNNFSETKYNNIIADRKTVNVPLEVNNNTLAEKIESYIENWHITAKVCNENRSAMNSVIFNKVNNINLENYTENQLKKLKNMSVAFIKSQSDTCTIGEITEIWLDLINQFKNEEDEVKIKIIKQFEMATTPAHYLANILDPRFEGKKLERSQLDKALEYVKMYHPEVVPDLIEYQAHAGPFKELLFTIVNKGNRYVKPIAWWKALEKSKQNQINEKMFILNKQLHSAIASSSGNKRLFSTFGFVRNKQVDTENQHFQWSHTSEDSYAEANDTNASGYEADSVLTSMMHESMDDYHNQEPIVDVQEPQTWSSYRKYRGTMQGTGGDYSDDEGGGTVYGNSRKVMRMSRPDEFSTFSDYVAERMRNLKADKALQLMARRDIEQVLFKYEMKLLEQKRDSQQQQQPDTEAATTSKSISPSPVSDMEQQ